MKGKRAKINRIFSASACLAAALALAAFSCFAWFTSSNNVNNDLSANVTDAYITDFSYTPYILKLDNTNTTSSTTYYTVGSAYGADTDDEDSFAIASYGSSTADATLLKVTYAVKGDLTTMLVFSGNGDATFTDPANSTGLSNAVSLRLLDEDPTSIVSGTTIVSSSETKRTFIDSSYTKTDKNKIAFTDITTDSYGTESATNSGYYDITVYLIMEYNDDNAIALYGTLGLSYAAALVCENDISLVVKDNNTTDTVSNVYIKGSSSLAVGSSTTLTASVIMTEGTLYSGTVTWESSNTSVATVDENGKVTGVATGTATITATAGGQSATYTITVTDGTEAATVSSVAISGSSSVTVGSTTTLTAAVTMSDSSTYYSGTVTWESTNTSVATVDENGVVTGVATGTATITATADDESATYTVTVSAAGTSTAKTYTIQYTAGAQTTENVAVYNATYTSTESETTSSITVDYSELTTVRESQKNIEDDENISYTYAYEIKSSKSVKITVPEGAENVSVTVYVSHTSSNSTRNVYIGTDTTTTTNVPTIAVVGDTSSPKYIYTLTASLTAGETSCIWSDNTIHLYAFSITYTI